MSEWTDTIDELIDYLRYQQVRGVRQVTIDLAALRKLSAAPHQAAPSATIVAAPPQETQAGDQDSDSYKLAALAKVAAEASACQRCALYKSRACSVFGQGNHNSPDIMFIGDSPSEADSRQGTPFSDEHGELLTRMISAMGYTRNDVYLTNICKCPPATGQRVKLNEMQSCLHYLLEQIKIIKPKVIVILGAEATGGLLGNSSGVAKLRGQWARFADTPTLATYHPKNKMMALRPAKLAAWNDLKRVLTRLGRPIPATAKK